MSDTRRDGHSKLVYNKTTRTIDTVDPHSTPAPPAAGMTADEAVGCARRIVNDRAFKILKRGAYPETSDEIVAREFLDLRDERDRHDKFINRLTEAMTRWGWSHCTSEVELIQQIDWLIGEREAAEAKAKRLTDDPRRWPCSAGRPGIEHDAWCNETVAFLRTLVAPPDDAAVEDAQYAGVEKFVAGFHHDVPKVRK